MYLSQAGESLVPLLKTKFFIPTQRTRCLERPRLLAHLDTGCPLTLVAAPAGFGKTTLVSDWLRARRLPVGWLSLDPADGEPRRFLSYLAGAADGTLPGVGTVLTELLSAPLPPLEALLTPFINELSRRSAKLILVLDDYHVIDHPEVHAAVEMLVERFPPGVRIVITTRAEPPLSLPRMRTRGLLQEVRAEDLRFNEAEIAAFFQDIMELAVKPSHTATLARRTEGWIAGLQLAALSLRAQPSIHHFVEGFTETNRYVLDYLAEEVLAGLDPQVVDFLLAASVVDRLSGPLCNALTGRQDGQTQLEALEAENLFIVPLDDRRAWYRFHHLFRSFLEQQLKKRKTEDERQHLHQRACDWLSAENLVDDAIQHALAARDRQRSLDLVEQHTGDLFRRGDVGGVMRWFDALPASWATSRAQLVIDRALALYLTFRWQEMAECLQISKKLMAEATDSGPDKQTLAGKQAALESFLATTQAAPERAICLARQALADLPEDDLILRASATVTLAAALIATDAFDAARPVLRDAVRWHRTSGDRFAAVVIGHLEGQIELTLGHLQSALDCYRRTREQVTPEGTATDPLASLLLVGEADVFLEWGELDRAQQLAEQATKLSEGISPITVVRGLVTLAGVYRSRRDTTRAGDVVRRLLQLVESANLAEWELTGETHWARVWCLEMRHFGSEEARSRLERWVVEHRLHEVNDLRAKLLSDMPKEAGILCAVRWLLDRGEDNQALELLAALRTEARAKGWRKAQIETWLLECQAFHRNPEKARAALRQALELAAPGGYIQVVADEGPWIEAYLDAPTNPLLADLPSGFRTRLLSALALDRRQQPTISLPEQLSSREIEVLAAIAEGLSNAATGRRLHIAPSTVKKHLENIYGKLGVHNRVEAIARCRVLGLFGSLKE